MQMGNAATIIAELQLTRGKFKTEIEALTRAVQGAQKPFVGVLGGKKLSQQQRLRSLSANSTTIRATRRLRKISARSRPA